MNRIDREGRPLRQGKTNAAAKILAEYESELDSEPVTGLSVLEGMADAMPDGESQRAFREALAKTRENARRALKGSPAGFAIFGDPVDGESEGGR